MLKLQYERNLPSMKLAFINDRGGEKSRNFWLSSNEASFSRAEVIAESVSLWRKSSLSHASMACLRRGLSGRRKSISSLRLPCMTGIKLRLHPVLQNSGTAAHAIIWRAVAIVIFACHDIILEAARHAQHRGRYQARKAPYRYPRKPNRKSVARRILPLKAINPSSIA